MCLCKMIEIMYTNYQYLDIYSPESEIVWWLSVFVNFAWTIDPIKWYKFSCS